MSLKGYLKDKILELLVMGSSLFVMLGMLALFAAPTELLLATVFLWLIQDLIIIGIDYGKKHRFYDSLCAHVENLDQKYLVQETLEEPRFYEGILVWRALLQMGRSMAENVARYRRGVEDFKDYIELWVHEVKIPIASLTLMCQRGGQEDRRMEAQLRRLDGYVEQALYYVRLEQAQKDYHIREVNLSVLVHNAAMKSKDDLLASGMALEVDVEGNLVVITDAKWLEFVLGQLIANSIKYKRKTGEPVLRVFTGHEEGGVSLHVWDNGIGIPDRDMSRIWEKSFTGENGRTRAKSTGMGLYLARQLCDRLGHRIAAESVEGEYTDIAIWFAKHDFYRPE